MNTNAKRPLTASWDLSLCPLLPSVKAASALCKTSHFALGTPKFVCARRDGRWFDEICPC